MNLCFFINLGIYVNCLRSIRICQKSTMTYYQVKLGSPDYWTALIISLEKSGHPPICEVIRIFEHAFHSDMLQNSTIKFGFTTMQFAATCPVLISTSQHRLTKDKNRMKNGRRLTVQYGKEISSAKPKRRRHWPIRIS